MILKSYEIQRKTSDISNAYMFLLYGENYGLKKEIKELIIKTEKQKDPKIELVSINENDATENRENFYNSIFSGSLFSNKKIITINNCSDKIITQIEDISEKYPENVILIFISDILDKKSKLRNFFEKNQKNICVACYLDNSRDLEFIALKNLKENNITISRESINLLIEKSNFDRNNLNNEIEKIKLYGLTKKNLDFDEVKSLINFSGEYKSDSLINECLSGNILQYKKILAELYMNAVNQIFLFRILSNKIQKLMNIKKIEKNYKDIDSLINAAKPQIFWKEKPIIKKQLTIWNFDDLKKILSEVDNVEVLCKKNPQSSNIIFFNFFTNICKKASNYS